MCCGANSGARFTCCLRPPQAALASGLVDAVLIPEVQFTLEGPGGLFAYLEGIMEKKGHCVVAVAEGAGQVSPTPSL